MDTSLEWKANKWPVACKVHHYWPKNICQLFHNFFFGKQTLQMWEFQSLRDLSETIDFIKQNIFRIIKIRMVRPFWFLYCSSGTKVLAVWSLGRFSKKNMGTIWKKHNGRQAKWFTFMLLCGHGMCWVSACPIAAIMPFHNVAIWKKWGVVVSH